MPFDRIGCHAERRNSSVGEATQCLRDAVKTLFGGRGSVRVEFDKISLEVAYMYDLYSFFSVAKNPYKILLIGNIKPFASARLLRKEWWRRRYQLRIIRYLCSRTATLSDLVVAWTYSSIRFLRKALRTPVDKIVVIPPGTFVYPTVRWRGKGHYILSVSEIRPHKNLETLIASLPMVEGRYSIFIVGRIADKAYYKRLRNIAARLGVDDRVLFKRYVPAPLLTDIYRDAAIFVNTSLLESFGICTAEALQHGVPVICADIDVHREVCKDSALFFDPTSPQDLASKINLLLASPNLREEYSLKGMMVGARYTWDNFARDFLNILQHRCVEQR